jgi:hypothetical protein
MSSGLANHRFLTFFEPFDGMVGHIFGIQTKQQLINHIEHLGEVRNVVNPGFFGSFAGLHFLAFGCGNFIELIHLLVDVLFLKTDYVPDNGGNLISGFGLLLGFSS